MRKLIAVHTVRVFVGLQRCDIAPGNPLPADVEPAAIDELLALGAVKEEDDATVAIEGAADLVPELLRGAADLVPPDFNDGLGAATLTGDGTGEPLPAAPDTAYPANAVALGNAEAPVPTPEPEVTPAPAPAAKSASKKVKAGQA